MLPALSPSNYHLVNNRSLSIRFDLAPTVVATYMLNPSGTFIHEHIMYAAKDGSYQTAYSSPT